MNDVYVKLKRKLDAQEMEPFMRSVRFPRFKNLTPGLSIEFTHSITVLTGPNGSNKSSILRALQACPRDADLGNYWFETGLDHITEGQPHRYIHAYRLPSGKTAEVIKTRVARSGRRVEYFETRAPAVRDGMQSMVDLNAEDPRDQEFRSSTRWSPIEKPVLYLDFRSELPAYDIFFNFHDTSSEDATDRGQRRLLGNRKELIRRRSGQLADALAGGQDTHFYYGTERILSPAAQLPPTEVKEISEILGRAYDSVRVIRHRFFNFDGYTVSLRAGGHDYSEAFAGSGEFAVVMLVHKIHNADPSSLIILDEPETSLHPAAQTRLMEYIANRSLHKGHQVVVSSHAESIVRNLPADSIRVLDYSQESNKVVLVAESSSPGEAFITLGAATAPDRIYVEDRLAAAFVLRAAKIRGVAYAKSIDLVPTPGGAGNLQTRVIPMLANTKAPGFALLDGDMRPAEPLRTASSVLDHELIAELEKGNIKEKHLLRDSGGSDDQAEMFARAREVLAWMNRRVRYLPGDNPDGLLWGLTQGERDLNSKDAKKNWRELATKELGLIDRDASSDEIFDTQRRYLTKLPDTCPELQALLTTLQQIVP